MRDKALEITAYQIKGNEKIKSFPKWLVEAYFRNEIVTLKNNRFFAGFVINEHQRKFFSNGDYIVNKNGFIYAIEKEVFELLYKPIMSLVKNENGGK